MLIRVHGAGLNPIDWKTRKGLGFVATQIEGRMPWTPGYDAAGEVVAVADDVTTLAPGDRVMGMIGFAESGGAYAQYAVARADELAIVPEELDLVTGGVPLAALTAWQALFEVAGLESGQKIPIPPSRRRWPLCCSARPGARCPCDCHSVCQQPGLAELGVHEVIDYHTDIADECYGLDVVLDLIGGETKRSLQTLSNPVCW